MIYLLAGMNIVLLGLLYVSVKRNKTQRSTTNNDFKEIVESSTEPLLVHRKGRIVYVNRAGADMMGLSAPDQLLNQKVSAFVEDSSYDGIRDDIKENLLSKREVTVKKPDGTQLDIETISSTIRFNGQSARKVSVRDITLEKQKTEELETFAFQDELTGLLNRRGFDESVAEQIEASRGTNQRFGVMFIDLDGFKEINDSMGHQVGDLILQRASEYLKQCVRKTDIVSRLGGDEFVILLPNATQRGCERLVERIMKPQSVFVESFDESIHVTPSIGVALSPENGEDIETLIQEADKAMYEAKRNGKNQYRFAEPILKEEAC